jgi:hypothetical protein
MKYQRFKYLSKTSVVDWIGSLEFSVYNEVLSRVTKLKGTTTLLTQVNP